MRKEDFPRRRTPRVRVERARARRLKTHASSRTVRVSCCARSGAMEAGHVDGPFLEVKCILVILVAEPSLGALLLTFAHRSQSVDGERGVYASRRNILDRPRRARAPSSTPGGVESRRFAVAPPRGAPRRESVRTRSSGSLARARSGRPPSTPTTARAPPRRAIAHAARRHAAGARRRSSTPTSARRAAAANARAPRMARTRATRDDADGRPRRRRGASAAFARRAQRSPSAPVARPRTTALRRARDVAGVLVVWPMFCAASSRARRRSCARRPRSARRSARRCARGERTNAPPTARATFDAARDRFRREGAPRLVGANRGVPSRPERRRRARLLLSSRRPRVDRRGEAPPRRAASATASSASNFCPASHRPDANAVLRQRGARYPGATAAFGHEPAAQIRGRGSKSLRRPRCILHERGHERGRRADQFFGRGANFSRRRSRRPRRRRRDRRRISTRRGLVDSAADRRAPTHVDNDAGLGRAARRRRVAGLAAARATRSVAAASRRSKSSSNRKRLAIMS